MKNYVMSTYLYAFLFGFFDRLLWGDGFGYSHDTDDAWNEWYDTGANWADKLPERVQVWFYQEVATPHNSISIGFTSCHIAPKSK